MSVKPSVHAEWDTNGTNLTPTTSGHKSNGWATNEIPTSAEFNHWQKQVSDWTEWLFDGDCSFNELVVAGSVTFTDVTTFALTADVNNADPMSNGTTNGLRSLFVDPNGAWDFNGLVGGAEGRELDIINADPNLQYFNIVHEASAATAANRFNFPLAIAHNNGAAATDVAIRVYPGGHVRVRYDATLDRWRVLSMEGCRVLRQMTVSANFATNISGTVEVLGTGQWTIDNATSLIYPLVLPARSVIDSYRVYYDKNSSGAVTLSSYIGFRAGNDGSLNTSPGDSDVRAAPGFDYLEETALEEVVVAHVGYFLSLLRSPDTSSGDVIYNAVVTYWDVI